MAKLLTEHGLCGGNFHWKVSHIKRGWLLCTPTAVDCLRDTC